MLTPEERAAEEERARIQTQAQRNAIKDHAKWSLGIGLKVGGGCLLLTLVLMLGLCSIAM